MLYSPNPDVPAYTEAERRQIVADHLAWALAQHEKGNAILAGAIADDPAFNGLGLFGTGSLDRVREIMAGDPAIRSGVDTYRLMTFVTRAGLLRRLSATDRP